MRLARRPKAIYRCEMCMKDADNAVGHGKAAAAAAAGQRNYTTLGYFTTRERCGCEHLIVQPRCHERIGVGRLCEQ